MSPTDQDENGGPIDAVPLEIPLSILRKMIDHCLRGRPDGGRAACSAARPPGPGRSTPLRNRLNSESRYDADPTDLILAVREIREAVAEIVAIYHSHPRWAAIPSRTDLAENHYGDVPRIIVSLLDDRPDVRIWRLEPDRYEELPWRVVDDPEPIEPQGPNSIDC